MRVRYLPVMYRDLVKNKYPSFSITGSIIGMKKKYYGEDALLVRCGQWIYKVPQNIYDMAH